MRAGGWEMNFTGKRVLVTGGTRGIGEATVRAFLGSGARVAVNGASGKSVEAALERLQAGERAVGAPGDLSVVAECERVVKDAVKALGGLDILINNAGVGGDLKPFWEVTPEDWDKVVNLNLRAAFFCTRYAVPALRAAKGNVVNVASILGLGGRGGNVALYCLSKGGVVNMTRDLAVALAPDVRVNCICPGAVDTEMLQELGRSIGKGDVQAGYAIMLQNRPMKRTAKASEIANGILYLASDLASFVTGAIHVADGGVMAKAG
jgi:NAD(P)-dependent dehydrogenase (short-subunit alcohol dehydrogenase family)